MKNLIRFAFTIVCLLFISAMIINPVSAQTTQKAGEAGKPLPDAVKKIAEKSCLKCHIEPGGNGMAYSVLNLGKWDSFSAEKQAEKAKAMSKKVSKGKMPPKSFKKEHPDGVPTQAEIKTISDWAQSLQPAKK